MILDLIYGKRFITDACCIICYDFKSKKDNMMLTCDALNKFLLDRKVIEKINNGEINI